MGVTTTERAPRRLGDELRRTFRTLLVGLTLVIVVLGALTWMLLGSIQPDLRYDSQLLRTLREAHEAMLDRDAALHSWLATGDTDVLATSERRASLAAGTSAQLLELIGHEPHIDRAIVELQLASQAWSDQWADPAATLDPTDLDDAALATLFDDGRSSFQLYRAEQQATTELVAAERDDALARMQLAIAIGLATTVSTLVLIGWLLARQRRRLDRELTTPLRSLLTGLEAIRRGEPADVADARGPAELRTLAAHLQETSERVLAQRRELEGQRADSEAASVTLSSILTVAREIAGSLNVRYVAETVAVAAADMSPCERAVVWLTSDGEDFIAVHDTAAGHGVAPLAAPVRIGDGPVGSSARDARPQIHAGSACFPLVVGGRVMGVLELVQPAQLDVTSRSSLETLATHAAAALEAARLHRATEELAQVDALTRLLNRRRLDGDLVTELDRANRYGRPLGFIMLDLDRFKQLNDTFGHQHGDEVLRVAGEYLATTVRTSDTVYRYGGEEFAVLVREGTRTACLELAERLRVGLSRTFAEREGFGAVTASFGVALAPEHGQTAAELILAADRALYDAKSAGRDRVMLAPLSDHHAPLGPDGLSACR